jgi:hypothetical protein
MTERYSAEDIPRALDQLLEAWRDQGEARNQLEAYRSVNPKPHAPADLDLDTLQDYHRRRMRYEAGLEQASLKLETSLRDYTETQDDVRGFLPRNRRLIYEYQGAREDIAGRYIIQDTGRRFIIEPYNAARRGGPGAYGGRP